MLSLRLKTLHQFYQNTASIWDIGCDHGLLGLSFKDTETVKSIHLVDSSADVIRVLEEKFKDSYISIPKLFIHCKRGQDVLLEPDSKTIFIAGMGGKEIEDILIHLIPQLTELDRVVISPHRKILELRKFLNASTLKLVREHLLEEDGQFYQMLCLEKRPDLPSVSLFGEEIWKGEVGANYLKGQYSAFKSHQDPQSKAYVEYLRSLIH